MLLTKRLLDDSNSDISSKLDIVNQEDQSIDVQESNFESDK